MAIFTEVLGWLRPGMMAARWPVTMYTMAMLFSGNFPLTARRFGDFLSAPWGPRSWYIAFNAWDSPHNVQIPAGQQVYQMSAMKQRLLRIVEQRHFVLSCLLAGLVLRLIWIAFVHAPQVSDFKWYFDRAVTMASGGGYSVNGVSTTYWPVGYPGFLGVMFRILGPSAFTGQLINIALSIAGILLTYLVSKEIFASEIAARITVFILCFYPNQVAFNSLLCTEIWFTFLLLLGTYVFIKARGRIGMLVLAGVPWGLATLTKPQFIFLPGIFMLVFFVNKKELFKAAAAVYLVIILCLLPWMMRNERIFGHPLLSSNGGIVLLQGNSPYATGTFVWGPELEDMLGEFRHGELGFGADEADRDQRARQVAKDYIRHHPVRVVMLWPKKIMYMYRSDVDAFYYSMGMMPDSGRAFRLIYVGLRVFAQIYYFFVFLLAAISMKVVLRTRSWPYKMGLLVVLYFTAIAVVFFALARYHYPGMPWVAMYSGIGASMLLGAWPKQGRQIAMAPASDQHQLI